MRWPHGDPDAVARGILAEPAYRAAAATTSQKPHVSLLWLALEWFWNHVLRPLLHPLARAVAASREAGTVAGIVLVALALAGLAYVAFRLALAFARGPSSGSRTDVASETLDAERSAPAWRALAREAAARGEYARAIAALFGAALAELDARAIVAYDASRTPGEYRRLVRRERSRASVPFDELAERFVRALYAAESAEHAEYEAAERALAAFGPALA